MTIMLHIYVGMIIYNYRLLRWSIIMNADQYTIIASISILISFQVRTPTTIVKRRAGPSRDHRVAHAGMYMLRTYLQPAQTPNYCLYIAILPTIAPTFTARQGYSGGKGREIYGLQKAFSNFSCNYKNMRSAANLY